MKKLRLNYGLIVILSLSLWLVACSEQDNSVGGTLNTVSAIANGRDNATPTPTVVAAANQIPPTDTPIPATIAPVATVTQIVPTTAATQISPTHVSASPVSGANLTGTPASAHATMVATGSLTEVLRGPVGKKQIAITLDAGSTAVAFSKEIAALDKYNVKVTFFLTGAWVRENPQYSQQIARDGMEIANHTYDHPWLTKMSSDKVADEINLGAKTIQEVTGINPRPLFRFPYGDYDARTMKILNNLGYRSIYWTYDSLDSVGAHKTADQLFHIVTSISDTKLDGAIILMHLGNDTSGDALGPIIQNLQGRGFKIVTISELIGK